MSPHEASLFEIVKLIRRNFWLLKAVSDHAIDDLDLTGSTRAIFEHLDEYGSSTVPQIAQHKAVARQSIQALADQLYGLGHINYIPNPKHKRSQLVEITQLGKSVYAKVRQRDLALLQEIAQATGKEETQITQRTLQTLNSKLKLMNEVTNDESR